MLTVPIASVRRVLVGDQMTNLRGNGVQKTERKHILGFIPYNTCLFINYCISILEFRVILLYLLVYKMLHLQQIHYEPLAWLDLTDQPSIKTQARHQSIKAVLCQPGGGMNFN